MQVHDTLSRRLQPLTPGEDGKLRIYVCGVTVYDRCHLGHGLSQVVFDVAVRWLRDRFGAERVKYVVNFTDIDDKILDAAARQGVPWQEVSERYIETFHEDMRLLNVEPADLYPKATENVPEMVALIRELEERGLAYLVPGDGVYFKVRGFTGYGKLSGRGLDDPPEGGGRVERDARFDHPADFCLWKFWDRPEAWDSPWGKGRPGWHIECSAMAEKHLGLPLDIHGGGMDLKFPHHENEIAQTEGAGRECFARIWMHHGLLNLDGVKVSKSLGNVLDIREIAARHGVGAIRHYFLGHTYGSPLRYEEKLVAEAGVAYTRILECRERLAEAMGRPQTPVGMNALITELAESIHESRTKFSDSMEADFNTTGAMAAIHELVHALNRTLGHLGDSAPFPALVDALKAGDNVLSRLMKILGFVRPDGSWLETAPRPVTDAEVGALVELALSLRREARERKDWAQADRIRKILDELGYEIQDSPKGSTWKRK